MACQKDATHGVCSYWRTHVANIETLYRAQEVEMPEALEDAGLTFAQSRGPIADLNLLARSSFS
jgi:hypothetical protein